VKVPEAAKNALLLVCATGLCLVLAELFLGRYLPGNRVIYQLDRSCLYRLTPASHKVFRHFKVNGGETIQVEVNSLGLRGDESPVGERVARRIVVYGDSFIEAEFSPLDQTFVVRLDRKLNEERIDASGRAVEVLNAGMIGYGPDQVAVRMLTELGSLRPDLVIVALSSGNDYGDLLRNKIYRLGDGGRLVDNAFVIDWRLSSQLARVGAVKPLDGGALLRMLRKLRWDFSRSLIERSGLPVQAPGEDVVEWSLRASAFEYEEYVLKKRNTVVNLFNDHYDADVSLRAESESARYKVDLMGQVVQRI
jgi:hypothetical protein